MTLTEAKRLSPGDTIRHSGQWPYRRSPARLYNVVTNDDVCIRLTRSIFMYRYEWTGCTEHMTREFFESCEVINVPTN